MKMFFGFMTCIMFVCLLLIEGFFGMGRIGLGTAFVMGSVCIAGIYGCAYLGGCFDDYKE